jgi:hypothetical protein
MCLRRAPEKYITGAMAPVGAALDRAALDRAVTVIGGTFTYEQKLKWNRKKKNWL